MASSSHSSSTVGGTTVGSILLYTKNGSSPCYDITVEPFEEVGDDKGLSRQSIEVNDENIANDRYTLLNDKLCNYLL